MLDAISLYNNDFSQQWLLLYIMNVCCVCMCVSECVKEKSIHHWTH